ncbi:DUF5675 family protein [Cryomorphaceae bacterium 1068]|nr:DUF5675 family protein [Cryomorphaceae bacterium 1068]
MTSLIRFFVILIVVFAVVLFAMRPDLLEDVWLWIVGLIGLIVKLFERAWNFIEEKIKPKNELIPATVGAGTVRPQTPKRPAESARRSSDNRTIEDFPKPKFQGITMELKRLQDDGASTLGVLSFDGEFYCYTLEDTYREVKLKGETRIPAGEYMLDFNEQLTNMTKRYRESEFFSEWFTYHLHLKNVPGFEGVYIHNGGHHAHTDGCILVSTDYIEKTENAPVTLTNSRNTFKNLYIKLKQHLDAGVRVRIVIENEPTRQMPKPTLS